MKQRIHDALLGIVGLAGVAFFALSGASCESPTMQCAVGHGPFTIVYEVVSGDAACYEAANKRYGAACAQYDLYDTDADCAGLAKVEHVAFSTYLGVVDRAESKDPATGIVTVTAKGADYNTRTIAVQSSTLGGLHQERDGAGNEAADNAYALGDYTSFPDAGDICYAGTGSAPLAAADMNVDAFDVLDDDGMVVETLPAVHLRQEWNDLKFFVTTGVPGTQVVGNMKFEDATAGCSVEYKFTGLYPAVFCGSPVMGHRDDDGDPLTASDNDTDDDGDPLTPVDNDQDADPATMDDPDEEVVLSYDPDDASCLPNADPAAGRVYGSGINPDFQTYCHPDVLHCVLKDGTGLVE